MESLVECNHISKGQLNLEFLPMDRSQLQNKCVSDPIDLDLSAKQLSKTNAIMTGHALQAEIAYQAASSIIPCENVCECTLAYFKSLRRIPLLLLTEKFIRCTCTK